MFTVPEKAVTEPDPSTISVHVAQESEYVPVEASIVPLAVPVRTREGAIVSRT